MHQTVCSCYVMLWTVRTPRVRQGRVYFSSPESEPSMERQRWVVMPHISGTRTARSRVHSSAKGPTSMHISLDNSWNLINKSAIFTGLVSLRMELDKNPVGEGLGVSGISAQSNGLLSGPRPTKFGGMDSVVFVSTCWQTDQQTHTAPSAAVTVCYTLTSNL